MDQVFGENVRILHVVESLRGGVASYLEEVLTYQKLKFGKDNIAVIVPSCEVQDLPSAVDIPVFTFESTHRRITNIPVVVKAMRQASQGFVPDVVHAHSSIAGAAARFCVPTLPGRPALVYCAHGWAFDRRDWWLKNMVFAGAEWLMSWLTDQIICISEHDTLSARAIRIPQRKLMTVRNGISVAPPPVPAAESGTVAWGEGLRVLFVGRFDRQKGIDLFCHALSSQPDMCGVAVGSAVVGGKTLVKFPSNVQCTGWLTRQEVQRYMASCDVLVMPSRWEGFGLSALEAMRAGKAVIASNVGGLKELIVDNKTGLLVEPDNQRALTAALASMTRERAEEMGAAARRRFLQSFTAERMNLQLAGLYTDLAQERARQMVVKRS